VPSIDGTTPCYGGAVDEILEFTEWARDILRRSQEAAARFNPDALIRLARTRHGVEAVLTDRPDPSDRAVELDGVTVYVERGLGGLVDIEEPHDRLVLRPAGSTPNPRPAH
jgi:hypothetical protein